MKKSFARKVALVMTVVMLLTTAFALSASAATYSNFNRTNAANYATTYATSPNSTYKLLDNDCTSFVSQAVAVGGVVSYISNYSTAPSVLKDWIMETNYNAWYMVKKTRAIGFDYWVYSNTWAFVNDFRDFQTNRAAKNATFNGFLSGQTPNTTTNQSTNFEYKLRYNAKVGQVWQLNGRHSIIITSVTTRSNGYNYVWYSAHSSNAKNQDIQVFLDYCWANKNTNIYSMDFTA
jgi:hypothetical protein